MNKFVGIFFTIFFYWNVSSALAFPNQTISGRFHHLIVSGHIQSVRLHPTQGMSYMVVHGAQEDIQANDFFIEDDYLKAHVGEGYPKFGKISLDIWVNNLQSMNIKGTIPVEGYHLTSNGLSICTVGSPDIHLTGYLLLEHVRIAGRTQLKIEGVCTKRLDLHMKGAAYAKLQGDIGIFNLDIKGHSALNMHWVNTYQLKFTLAGYANVQMAGAVQVLDLDMYDHAQFGGRYLRANRVFLKTNDFSEAQISAVRSQHTYALDHSHIDYFNIPLMKTDLMVLNGETLDLREWSQRFAINDATFGD